MKDEKIVWSEELKKEYLRNIESELDFVNDVKEHLDIVRPEPLNVAVLLAEKKVMKVDQEDKGVANISLHSFKY